MYSTFFACRCNSLTQWRTCMHNQRAAFCARISNSNQDLLSCAPLLHHRIGSNNCDKCSERAARTSEPPNADTRTPKAESLATGVNCARNCSRGWPVNRWLARYSCLRIGLPNNEIPLLLPSFLRIAIPPVALKMPAQTANLPSSFRYR